MNAAQVKGMGGLWSMLTELKSGETMLTARQMAERSHKLNRNGTVATEPDGTKWSWNERLQHWVK